MIEHGAFRWRRHLRDLSLLGKNLGTARETFAKKHDFLQGGSFVYRLWIINPASAVGRSRNVLFALQGERRLVGGFYQRRVA